MKAPELKPCPFCGAAAEFEAKPGSWGYSHDMVRVRCKGTIPTFLSGPTCFATTNFEDCERWEHGRGTVDVRKQAYEKVAAQWNRRSPDPRQSPEG